MPRGDREREAWKRLKRNLNQKESEREVKLKVNKVETVNKEEIIPAVEEYWRKIMTREVEIEEIPKEDFMIWSDKKAMDRIVIEEQDIVKAQKKLKNRKACGNDEVLGEFIKNGGDALKRSLHQLFNEILKKGEVPNDWRESRITLIHKGGGKPKENIENYRPIAVINILAKVFGMVLNEKITDWAERQRVWGEEQSGFRKGRNGLENVLILKELIERAKNTGRELYLTFIDIEKAYDTVDRKMLMHLLNFIGMDTKVIKVIESMYQENKVKFTIGEISTGWVENNVGVKQGCTMSTTLFNMYFEELVVRIRKSGIGVKIGNSKLGCLAYADDLVLMTESKQEMEELLRIATKFGRDFKLNFSARKCQVMEFNNNEENQWILGNNILEVVEKYTYLGMEVSKEGIGQERQRKINEGKASRMSGMIINGGNMAMNKYSIGRSLWKGMAVPYCLYGSEITNYTETEIMKMEKVQNIVGRWSLGAPRSTGLEAIRGDMGWSTFKERIVKGKLCFARKIENLSEERWAKKILTEEDRNSKWKKEIKRWKKKENLEENWNTAQIKDIKITVQENGKNKWQRGMEGKSTLKWYTKKEKPEEIEWHSGDWGSKLLFKARAGVLEVNGRKRNEEEQNCKFCNEKETIEHLIVECSEYDDLRETLIRNVTRIIGNQEWRKRLEEEDGGVCTVLGLYGNKYEAQEMAKYSKAFLVGCLEKRAET